MLKNVAKSIGELSDTLVILLADTLIIRYWYWGVSPVSLVRNPRLYRIQII